MRTLLFVLAFFFALSFAADSDVVVLTTDTFSQTSSGTWLIEFYAPWCGHCKRLVPTWEELATTVKGKFNVAKVDCTVEKDVASSNGIRGFPTIKLFHNGQVSEFNGARTVEAFVEFVETQTGTKLGVEKKAVAPAVKAEAGAPAGNSDLVILTDATFGQKTATGTWLVKFYAPWCGHCKRLAPTWDELATNAKGSFNVAKVDCTVETGSCTDIRGYPTIKLFHNGQVIPYNGPRTIDAFASFVTEKTGGEESVGEQANAGAVEAVPEKKDAPLETEGDLVILTNENFEEQTKDGVWFVKFYAPWCGHCKNMAPTWTKYATTVKDRQLPYKVAKVDCTVQRDVCQKHAIRGYPTLKLLKGGDAYDYNGGREEPAFLKFVDDYFTAWGTPKQEL
jgi:thioredoxin domain-containing protein 5